MVKSTLSNNASAWHKLMFNRNIAAALLTATLLAACGTEAPPTTPAASAATDAPTIEAAPVQVEKPAEIVAPDFSKERTTIPVLDALSLRLSCDGILRETAAEFDLLAHVPMDEVNTKSILDRWDTLLAQMENADGPISLLTYVSPDAKVRAAGEPCLVKLSEFGTTLFQRADLYERVKATAPDANDPAAQQLRKDLLESFDDNGIGFAPEKRRKIKAIKKEIQTLAQEFSRNIRENSTKLTFTPEESQGLPQSYLDEAKRDENGNLLLGFDYPEVFPFLQNATNEEARKRYLTAFSQRGTKKNIDLLNKIMGLRKELAAIFGLPSYAHYVTQRRMVENPETVIGFLDGVRDRVQAVEVKDIAELKTLKAELTGTPEAETNVWQWDKSFLKEQLNKQRYEIDQEALREYFPTRPAVDWGLWIAEQLYGVKFYPAEVPLWDPDVLYFDVMDQETKAFIGGIYLDLYPRDGKYKHAAAFPVRGVSERGKRRPISVLVTNFNREGLTHGELETLLHELGHVFHGVLSKTQYVAHAGTSVKRDFVEAPSQMFEEWARQPETLQRIPDFCKSVSTRNGGTMSGCPKLDTATIERLQTARRFGRGIDYSRQHLYADFDMRLAGEQPPESLALWHKLEGATPLGLLTDGEFPGTFGHIAGGYAAGYYGYMWSEVLALDMLSAFGDNLLNEKVGMRFRKSILEQGGQKSPKALVSEFLGRDANAEAFFSEITGQRK